MRMEEGEEVIPHPQAREQIKAAHTINTERYDHVCGTHKARVEVAPLVHVQWNEVMSLAQGRNGLYVAS